MSTRYVLRPNSTITVGGWSAVPVGSSLAVIVADDSDATYIAHAHGYGGTPPGLAVLGFPDTVTLAPGQVVARLEARLRANIHPGGSLPGDVDLELFGANPVGDLVEVAGLRYSLDPSLGAQAYDVWGSMCTFTPGGPITQADLSGLTAYVRMWPRASAGTSVVWVYAVEVVVVVVDPGTLTITAPAGTVITPAPSLDFFYSYVGDLDSVVEGLEVVVYTVAQTLAPGFGDPFDPTWVAGAAQHQDIPYEAATSGHLSLYRLPQGDTYRVFARMRKRVTCYVNGVPATTQFVFAEASSTFTVAPTGFGTTPLGEIPQGVGARLGCGAWRAFVTLRGSDTPIGEFRFSGLSGVLRVLNETAQVSLTVPARDVVSCRRLIGVMRPFTHEVHLYRDGRRVFVGVPGPYRIDATAITVPLFDLSVWFSYRALAQSIDAQGVDLAQLWLLVADHTLALENSMGLDVSAEACGVVGDRTLYRWSTMVGDAMRDLESNGVDAVCVERRLVAGGLSVPVAGLPGPLADRHVADASTADVLSRAASRVILTGQGGGAQEPPVQASAGGITGPLGLVERLEQVTEARTAGELATGAASRLALWTVEAIVPQPVLRRDSPYALEQLVPGAVLDVAFEDTILPVDGRYRIERVSVEASVVGEGAVEERVTLALQQAP